MKSTRGGQTNPNEIRNERKVKLVIGIGCQSSDLIDKGNEPEISERGRVNKLTRSKKDPGKVSEKKTSPASSGGASTVG